MKVFFLILILITTNIYSTSILDKVKDLDYKIFKISKSIKNTKSDILNLNKKTNTSKLKIKNLKSNNKELENKIKKRVKLLFQIIIGNNNNSLFSNTNDALIIEKKEKFLKIIINNDLEMIKKYLLKLKEIKIEISKFKKEINSIQKHQNRLIEEKENLLKERKKKIKYIKSIRKSKRLTKELKNEEKDISKNISKKLKRNNGNINFVKMKGSFDFPVNAKVYKWYYVKYIKSKKTYEMHKGLTFKVGIGTRVHSIYRGKIVFANYIKGYGKTIILSHGGGYYTIYMHLSKIIKKSGAEVKIRDIIALTGDTGSTEYPKLYFEIRKKKNPINLNKWFNIKK